MMVGWDEIYPHDPNLLLHTPDKKYWVIDAYCVNPQCDCKNMGLSFMYASENKTLDVGGILMDLNNSEGSKEHFQIGHDRGEIPPPPTIYFC